ncbi:acyl-CoA dehydrogenase [Virgisporangium aliadipatigenens]|uniref:Acyl-CoA dehydrogenase n=1 Tax=Virgisporangium aliadipatigenens TaxID=741659 RepID=A0A8J3YM40_9ACTN|nr:acyl-CoA dehydrogenase family protein [Virgisporangium aliadipatigenens]GIJ46907.1 acyl-CoA dehydrogenase [Virgisporangium aliadipatigenens]
MTTSNAIPDLLYDEVDDDLRASVRDMLATRAPWDKVLARIDAGESYDASLWRVIAADMGLAGLAIPESAGGAGAGFRRAAVVLEELGRAVAPVPYLGSAVVATQALLRAGETDLLAELASGERSAALAVPFALAPQAFTADPAGSAFAGNGVAAEGDSLSGTVKGVADALIADVLLVPASGRLFAVEAADATRTPLVSLDATRQLADVTFAGAVGREIASGERAAAAVRGALVAGAALLASEQLGIAEWCLSTTVDYLRTRYQFGRPVGSFQALKHRLADLWMGVTEARAVARYAAAVIADDGDDAEVAAALAQAYCGPLAVTAAEECVQLHGGIGFTWEHPAHLYLKRAKSASVAFGVAARHRAAIGSLVNLPSS